MKAFTRIEARECSDWLSADSPRGLRLVQITSHPKRRSSTIYGEAHAFTPDGRLFLFQRFTTDEPWENRPPRQYWACDTKDHFRIRQLTDEEGAIAPSMSPDGKWLYYFVDETRPGKGRLAFKRMSLEDSVREEIMAVDGPLKSGGHFLSRLYSFSTISADGRSVATAAFLGDGNQKNAPWGIVVFDIERAEARLIFEDAEMCNAHPQYSRSVADAHKRDILFQHNHGSMTDRNGNVLTLGEKDELGPDIHVVHDDGADLRDLPFGRSKMERCHGHQEWRGRLPTVIAGVYRIDGSGRRETKPLLEGAPISSAVSHAGSRHGGTPGAAARELALPNLTPWFGHSAVDESGARIVADWVNPHTFDDQSVPEDEKQKLFIGTIEDGREPLCRWKYLLNPLSSWKSQIEHPHPCLSPDGTKVFFNSDRSRCGGDHIGCVAQVWLVTDFSYA